MPSLSFRGGWCDRLMASHGFTVFLFLAAFVVAIAAALGVAWTGVTISATVVAAATPAVVGDGIVTIPWGDWLGSMLEPLGALAIAIVMWMLRRLPASIYLYLQMARAEQLVQRAVDYALSATAGATQGKSLDIKVTSQVLEAAAEYAVAHAPGLVKTLGGTDLLKQKVLARLDVAEDVSAEGLRQIRAF
ncbi:hypothetical protein GCM10019059_34780 [Camelimonas fluminis]|uniref:Uncharacterized protein n=1 Tax=Camelimonas fluminis TaxID=1576911 RepID=A0ABV7UGK5_9HYPH|nr:hypothetical protein [Camelimonas fluminis]GHE72217.1 hypothetical protein GCM10019059_34780 [Camelimonas fluminis]